MGIIDLLFYRRDDKKQYQPYPLTPRYYVGTPVINTGIVFYPVCDFISVRDYFKTRKEAEDFAEKCNTQMVTDKTDIATSLNASPDAQE